MLPTVGSQSATRKRKLRRSKDPRVFLIFSEKIFTRILLEFPFTLFRCWRDCRIRCCDISLAKPRQVGASRMKDNNLGDQIDNVGLKVTERTQQEFFTQNITGFC